jgi:hypothetical protein
VAKAVPFALRNIQYYVGSQILSFDLKMRLFRLDFLIFFQQ